MATYGEYRYNNHTLLNPVMNMDDFKSTSYHEYTHMILTSQSCIGMLLYCFEKIIFFYDAGNDKKYYDSFTGFLNRHTNKVQEGLAVFMQCVMKLLHEGNDSYVSFVDDLRSHNRTYFKYIKPLLFICEFIRNEPSEKEKIKTANFIFMLGVESMNGEIYNEKAQNFRTNKDIKKMISNPDFSNKYLPDSRFIRYLKKCQKNVSSCKDIQRYIGNLLGEETLNITISKREERLRCIKKFIIDFFGDSDHLERYKKKLDKITITEVNYKDLYLQQLPTNFNEEMMLRNAKTADINVLKSVMRDENTIIQLYGTLEDVFLEAFNIFGVTNEYGYDKEYSLKMGVAYHYDLKEKRILALLEECKNINKLLLSNERKSLIVVNYKVYDFEAQCIKAYPSIDDEIFIYCDRTYINAKCYLDMWNNKKVFFTYMYYENMTVLIVKIAKSNYFILPMTSIVADEALRDISENRKNMLRDNDNSESEYDKYIITDDLMRNKIDTIINCLYFIT